VSLIEVFLGKVSRVKIGDLGCVILSMHNPLLRCSAVEVGPKGEGALYISWVYLYLWIDLSLRGYRELFYVGGIKLHARIACIGQVCHGAV
jgi:hypothetical protein